MNRYSKFITLLMAVLTALAWGLANQPDIEPPWPSKIDGFAFSPMRVDDNPSKKRYPTIAEIDEDLALLAGDAHAIRTYTVEDNLGQIPELARGHGFNVTLGA